MHSDGATIIELSNLMRLRSLLREFIEIINEQGAVCLQQEPGKSLWEEIKQSAK